VIVRLACGIGSFERIRLPFNTTFASPGVVV
jgi:hypothetical protein